MAPLPLLAILLTVSNPGKIPFADGFLVCTKYGTIARFQRGFGDQDFRLLLAQAEKNAAKKPPNEWRVLFSVVRAIDADWEDKSGAKRHTKTTINDEELARCKEWFAQYKQIVTACTNGAMKIVEDYVEVPGPIKALDGMGPGAYWLSPGTALAGHKVEDKKYDSVIVYYRPGDIPMGLLGGTLGKDVGIADAAVCSVQVPESIWKAPQPFFNLISVATQHEWLHQMSSCSRFVMGYLSAPDCHSAEEYGWTDMDGGYKQWFAYNRDLMLRSYTEGLWRAFDMHLRPYSTKLEPVNKQVRPGRAYKWAGVEADWERRLPTLTNDSLRTLTGLPGLSLALKQYRPNDYCQLVVGGYPGAEDAAEEDMRLNNILSMGRPKKGPALDDPLGGYGEQALESMAVVRYRPRRDLVFVRIDVAGPVLSLLKTRGAKAAERVLGYVSLPDPSEGHPMVFIVADVDLGPNLPATELAAIGR